MTNIKIYVATHKKFDKIISNDLYTPIFVGAYKTNEHFGYLADNVGDNISQKNNQYSEITGLYWIWKHSNEDIIGLCHYRRYFIKNLLKSKVLTKEDIDYSLKNHDIILHERKVETTIYNKFKKYFFNEDFVEKSIDIFKRVHPDYIETFDKIFYGRTDYACSCFITHKHILNDYCEWLFAYLNALEKELKIPRERTIGYYAEELLIVYVIHNKLKVKKYPFYYVSSKNNLIANMIDRSYILTTIYYTIIRWTSIIH